MRKILLIAVAVGAAALGGFAAIARSSDAGAAVLASAEKAEATARFSIKNMTCATCPISVRKAMMRVDGVKSVTIDFDTKIATVVYDPAVTTPAAIAAASTNIGYPASELDA
ncbi:MAG: heavy-metal-associated domain-containing protein [Alphaproteobacteria bacterium]|nr:heavy-metal-associated domain-containing protein [Alphaproteobacteria bacterium]